MHNCENPNSDHACLDEWRAKYNTRIAFSRSSMMVSISGEGGSVGGAEGWHQVRGEGGGEMGGGGGGAMEEPVL